jgi:flagella basal body P-ring formation protein FlgA
MHKESQDKAWATFVSGILLLFCTPSIAVEQSHDSIYTAASQYVQQRLNYPDPPAEVTSHPLDSRLSKPACRHPLEGFEPPGFRTLGRTTIGVRCSDPSWSLFIPINIRRSLDVLVAKHQLSRGDILQAKDLRSIHIDSSKVYGDFFEEADLILGKRLRRDVRRNTILKKGMLITPKAVKYGNLVTLITRVGGIEVRMKGKAMGQGGIGDRVAVRNLSSKKQVEGIIRSPGLVEMQ